METAYRAVCSKNDIIYCQSYGKLYGTVLTKKGNSFISFVISVRLCDVSCVKH